MRQFILSVFILALITPAGAQLNTEQKVIKKVFTDFLKFYEGNEKAFNSFRLYKGTGEENGPPYKIQWKEAERYFTYLRTKVPFVGEAYISSERKDFKFYDSCYKADPQEEMPVGFDYDRWGGGQESIEYMIKWYTDPANIYQVKITGNKATLRIGAVLWEGSTEENRSWSIVPFVKEKGKWKMAANISPEDYEETPATPLQ
jgi:hypothetical protein